MQPSAMDSDPQFEVKAHTVLTPLTTCKWTIDLVLEDSNTKLSEDMKNSLIAAQAEVDKAIGKINKLIEESS